GQRPVDGVHLGEIHRVAQAAEVRDVGVGQRQRRRRGEPGPGGTVELDERRRGRMVLCLARQGHGAQSLASSVAVVPRPWSAYRGGATAGAAGGLGALSALPGPTSPATAPPTATPADAGSAAIRRWGRTQLPGR